MSGGSPEEDGRVIVSLGEVGWGGGTMGQGGSWDY